MKDKKEIDKGPEKWKTAVNCHCQYFTQKSHILDVGAYKLAGKDPLPICKTWAGKVEMTATSMACLHRDSK